MGGQRERSFIEVATSAGDSNVSELLGRILRSHYFIAGKEG